MGIANTLTQAITDIDITDASVTTSVSLSTEALESYVGHYHAYAGDYYVSLGAKGLDVIFEDVEDEEEPSNGTLNPVGDECFEQKNAQGVTCGIVRFMKLDDEGHPGRLYAAGRLFQRQ